VAGRREQAERGSAAEAARCVISGPRLRPIGPVAGRSLDRRARNFNARYVFHSLRLISLSRNTAAIQVCYHSAIMHHQIPEIVLTNCFFADS
jgi:hypothetical protein